MDVEWADKPREERRQKIRELYNQHATRSAAIATTGQATRVAQNLTKLRERLLGQPSPPPEESQDKRNGGQFR